jgi:hypothetical protein
MSEKVPTSDIRNENERGRQLRRLTGQILQRQNRGHVVLHSCLQPFSFEPTKAHSQLP